MAPKWPWHVQDQKYQHASYIQPSVPNFGRFRSTISHFWVTLNFWKSAPNDRKWPWHVEGQKYQNACTLIPARPKFLSLSLYNKPFLSYGSIFRNVHRMILDDLDMLRSKIPTCILHTALSPKFWSLSLYDKPFLSYAQFLEKCTKWPQMTLTCWRSKIPKCMYINTREAQIFVPFTLQ